MESVRVLFLGGCVIIAIVFICIITAKVNKRKR